MLYGESSSDNSFKNRTAIIQKKKKNRSARTSKISITCAFKQSITNFAKIFIAFKQSITKFVNIKNKFEKILLFIFEFHKSCETIVES